MYIQIIEGTLNNKQRADINMWHKDNGKVYVAACYFWCTDSGEPPKPQEPPNTKLINQLV